MTLDLRRLAYFVSVCDKGSMTAGAAAACVTQPVLSYHVAQLEKSFGERLLHRRPHGVEPTEAGLILLNQARTVLASVAGIEQAMRERQTQPSGPVTVGLLSSISATVGPALMQACRARFPGITLRITESDSLRLRRGVEEGVFDLAVNLREKGGNGPLTLLFEDLHLFARRGALGLRRNTLPLADALRHRLVLPPRGHVVRELLEKAAQADGLTIHIEAEVEGLATLKSFVVEGIGPAILGFGAIRGECGAGLFEAARIVRPTIQRELVFDRAARSGNTRAAAEVAALLIRAVQDLAP